MKSMLAGLLALTGLIGAADASCYLVYDGQDKVIYQASIPPVDMSLPVSDQIRARFPDGHLVFTTEGASCSSADIAVQPAFGKPVEPQFPESEVRPLVSESSPETRYGGMPLLQGRGRDAAGTDVAVRSYWRRDGTAVSAHTRAAPRRR